MALTKARHVRLSVRVLIISGSYRNVRICEADPAIGKARLCTVRWGGDVGMRRRFCHDAAPQPSAEGTFTPRAGGYRTGDGNPRLGARPPEVGASVARQCDHWSI